MILQEFQDRSKWSKKLSGHYKNLNKASQNFTVNSQEWKPRKVSQAVWHFFSTSLTLKAQRANMYMIQIAFSTINGLKNFERNCVAILRRSEDPLLSDISNGLK